MPRFIFLAYTNAIEGKEAEFNRWYDTEHVPDVLGTPGFAAAQRFRASEHQIRPDQVTHQFLTIYEIEAPTVADAISEFGQRARAGGIRMSDAVDAASATMTFYEAVTESVTGA